MNRIKSGEFPWKSLRKNFFNGYHQSLAAYTQHGNNLIIEHIIETQEWMHDLVELFKNFDVFFVGLHCPVPELQRREQRRGDRPAGDAARDFDIVHQFTIYDLELDSIEAPAHNVTKLISAWKQRTKPSAFQRMTLK